MELDVSRVEWARGEPRGARLWRMPGGSIVILGVKVVGPSTTFSPDSGGDNTKILA